MRHADRGVPRFTRARRHPFLCIAIFAFAFCASPVVPASATVLLPADFPTVVEGAALIVHGRVVDVRSELTGPRRLIRTVVTVAVIDALKGAPGATVTFTVPNGQIGRYRRILVGAPEFRNGDEVVVFLQGRAPGVPTLFGLSQGVFRVHRDPAARALVMPPPAMARGLAAERVVRGDPVRQPMPIADFTTAVKSLLQRDR